MNDPSRLTPPLSPSDIAVQTGRLMDVCMEAARVARDAFPNNADGTPSKHFGPAYRFERAKGMHRAGLPSSLLGDGRTASERHYEMLDELTGGKRA